MSVWRAIGTVLTIWGVIAAVCVGAWVVADAFGPLPLFAAAVVAWFAFAVSVAMGPWDL